MSLTSALSMFSLDRQRARYVSERVQAEEVDERGTGSSTEETANNTHEPDLESNESPASSTTRSSISTTTTQDSASASNVNQRSSSSISNQESREEEENEETNERLVGETLEESGAPSAPDTHTLADRSHIARGNTMTLAELEEQRELSRRRSSACVLLAVFVLFRLWIECLQKADPTLLLLCLLGTSWTARWIRFNREREEELDRRIELYLQNNNNTTEVDRNEYARLSFQAQLALAIMESQRHMMEGGFGRPDGADELRAPGVSDEAKSRWKQFHWKPAAPGTKGTPAKKGDYGAVPTKGSSIAHIDNHCSICLSEYEESDSLIQLPCGHVYHEECIQAWTQNHVKCPLCNFDLEQGTPSDSVSSGGEADSIV